MAIVFEEPHGPRREAEYPPVGEQLDAIWKAFASMDPASVPAPARDMLERIQAVKAKYPIPPSV